MNESPVRIQQLRQRDFPYSTNNPSRQHFRPRLLTTSNPRSSAPVGNQNQQEKNENVNADNAAVDENIYPRYVVVNKQVICP